MLTLRLVGLVCMCEILSISVANRHCKFVIYRSLPRD